MVGYGWQAGGASIPPTEEKGVVGEMLTNWRDLFSSSPRNPDEHLVLPYNCPTGTCAQDKVCNEISTEDTIDPFGRAHIERNACNQCPSSAPQPVRIRVRPRRWHRGPVYKIDHFVDSQSRRWLADSSLTAPIFHGDAGFFYREIESMTFRLERGLSDDERGWQCRYYFGVLDDQSSDMGTYDYADAPSGDHTRLDVDTHLVNPNYAANLTTQG